MSTFEAYYDINPMQSIDQNQWDVRMAEINMQFHLQPVVYTPLIDWDDTQSRTHAKTTIVTEMLEGDVDTDEIPFSANYIGVTTGVDSRSRSLASTRYGDKVQMHESMNIFQQWKMSGGQDWRPLLRGLLGQNVIRKHELLARNAYMMGPKEFWTYAGGATSFAGLDNNAHRFSLDIVNDWRLRLGSTGNPIIPGDMANAKIVMVPPGVTYDIMKQLPTASGNETSLWRDAQIYAGQAIKYEIGSFKGVRFVEVPNNRYGENLAVLYNAGPITAQYMVVNPIKMGDGSPDPENTKVDEVWSVGQKDVVHYIQLESGADMTKFTKNEFVSIHLRRTAEFGVTGGVDFRSGKTITRRVVDIDSTNKRLAFDRPVMFNYDTPFVDKSVTGNTELTGYAFVTIGLNVGFCLVLGSRGGIMGSIARPMKFYEPKPVDDFESVWRFVWDAYEGYNIWEPDLFECHFCLVSIPKIGGVIAPPAAG